MKLTFEIDQIDSVEIEGDHIYVYFVGALAVCFNKFFFDKYLDSIEVRKYEWVYENKENFEANIKDFLKLQVERQEKYS